MLFNFKKKKLILDCFTYRPDTFNLQPIQKANKFYPKWWSELPSYKSLNIPFGGSRNMRGCVGLTQLYSKGVILPMWVDGGFTIAAKGNDACHVEFVDNHTQLEIHATEQRGSYLNPTDYQALKITSPWLFKCSKPISWVWQQPVWNYDKPEEILILPAILDYHYNTTTNINMVFPRAVTPQEIILKFGTPLVHLIPMSEDTVEVRNHLVSREEYDNIDSAHNASISFTNSYAKRKKILSKCPMGH